MLCAWLDLAKMVLLQAAALLCTALGVVPTFCCCAVWAPCLGHATLHPISVQSMLCAKSA